jgi:hypothetical protein
MQVVGSVINLGNDSQIINQSPRSTLSSNRTSSNYELVLREFRDALRADRSMGDDERIQAERLARTAAEELAKEEPDTGLLDGLFSGMQAIAINGAGNGLWAAVAALMARLLVHG